MKFTVTKSFGHEVDVRLAYETKEKIIHFFMLVFYAIVVNVIVAYSLKFLVKK